MYDYIIGNIKEINSNYIVIDNNNIGYKIFVPNPFEYKLEEAKIYLYTYIREDEQTLYGFKDKEERQMFFNLISVKGVGPKVTLPMLASGSTKLIKEAIDNGDINYLTKFPKIGEKVARQIILDLKGKLVEKDKNEAKVSSELNEALKALGYKQKEIDNISSNINKNEEINLQIKQALKLLMK